MTVVLIVIVVLIVLAVIYTIATFNGLIKLQNRADEGFSDIDVQLKRRHDLIPNLVETVKGYAAHERQTLENVTAARAAAVSATGPAAQAQAENQLTGALRQLFAVAENYPDLKASQNFLELQNELTDTEDKIQAARRFFNMTVRDLNIKVQSFPSQRDREHAWDRAARVLRARRAGRPRGSTGLVRHPGDLVAPPHRRALGRPDVYKQISANKRNSIFLLFGFLLLYGALGWLASLWLGQAAFFIAIFIAVFMVIINLYMGDDLVALVSGAHQVKRKEEAPELWRRVENLAITAGLPMPRIYIANDDSPNAFAAGRNPKQAIVCVTTGLLARLDEEELEGVLAHELSHIRNYDVRLMTWAAVLAGSIALLANILLRSLWFGGGDRDRGGGAQRADPRGRDTRRDPRPCRSGRDPARDQPPARVRGRRLRSRADALPGGARLGAANDLGEREAVGHALEPVDRAHDDRAPAGSGGQALEAVLDPPAERGADRASRGDGRRRPAPPRAADRGRGASARGAGRDLVA